MNKLEKKLWVSIYKKEFDFIRGKTHINFDDPKKRADKALKEFRESFK